MSTRRLRMLGFGPLWLALACGGEASHGGSRADGSLPELQGSPALFDGGLNPPDDTDGPMAEPAVDAGPAPEPVRPSAPDPASDLRPQTNVSFDSAERIDAGAQPHLQDVRRAGQRDYYVFAGEAGDYVEITTDSGRFRPNSRIALFDGSRNAIAENDHGGRWPGDGIDARLLVRLPVTGDYYVVVEDPHTPPAFFETDFALLYYHLAVTTLETGDGLSIARGGEPVAGAFLEDEETGFAYLTALFELGAEPRTLSFAGRAGHALIGSAWGDDVSEHTPVPDGAVAVTDAAQVTVAAIDRSLGQHSIDPPVHDGDYALSVGAVESTEAHPFAVVELLLVPENPSEQDELGNNELMGAEAIAFEGDQRRRALVLLSVPAGDVDYLRIEPAPGDQVGALCEGQSGGSGVRSLVAELVDESKAVLASAAEAPDQNLSLAPTPVPADGPVYLRVTNSAVDDDIEPWVRCGVYLGP